MSDLKRDVCVPMSACVARQEDLFPTQHEQKDGTHQKI